MMQRCPNCGLASVVPADGSCWRCGWQLLVEMDESESPGQEKNELAEVLQAMAAPRRESDKSD